jgi:hypothetical protein
LRRPWLLLLLSLVAGGVLSLVLPQTRQSVGYLLFLLLSRLGMPAKWLYDIVG